MILNLSFLVQVTCGVRLATVEIRKDLNAVIADVFRNVVKFV